MVNVVKYMKKKSKKKKKRYLENSHGNHHTLFHIVFTAEFLILRQEVVWHCNQGISRPALEPVHCAAWY